MGAGETNNKIFNRTYAEDVFWRLFEATYRKCNRPSIFDSGGIERGYWEDNNFYFYDNYIPRNFNRNKKSIREIKIHLEKEYAISFSSIPFINGRMDFSKIAIAMVELEDVLSEFCESHFLELNNKYELKDVSSETIESLPFDVLGKLYDYVFTPLNRNRNFNIADRIASINHMFIPGLGKYYSADELKQWRKQHSFTVSA